MSQLEKKAPMEFKVGKTYEVTSNDSKSAPRILHVVSVVRDEYDVPKEGRFWDIIVTYRWYSDYRGHWIYAVSSDWLLSYQVRSHKKMIAAEKRRNTNLKKKLSKS